LNGTRPKPTANSSDYASWQADNSFVRRVIVTSIPDVLHVIDENERSACNMWSTLKTQYQPSDLEARHRILQSFFSLKLESATTEAFDAFEQDYRRLSREIESSKMDLSEIITHQLLLALPDSMSNFRTANLIWDMDQDKLPSREKLISTIKSSVSSHTNWTNMLHSMPHTRTQTLATRTTIQLQALANAMLVKAHMTS
jgi:hypothetical protein